MDDAQAQALLLHTVTELAALSVILLAEHGARTRLARALRAHQGPLPL